MNASKKADRAHNALIEFVEGITIDSGHRKPLINLSMGDPTLGDFISCPNILSQALIGFLDLHTANGYQPSCGNIWARKGKSERVLLGVISFSHVT